ncbi:MAG: MBL fold metallo-hydrolase [Armatimonadia bacterium]|nr:MBL fold metallo-hydrolase [Armatimonadia bacterium]
MILESLTVGALQANCYIVGCPETQKGLIIDPGGDAEAILEAVDRLGLDIEYIFDTHEHVDHIAANAAVRKATGATLVVHEAGRRDVEHPHAFWASMVGGVDPCEPDETMEEGDAFEVGTLTVDVLHTPGHSPAGVCLAVGDALFTGDTLFAGSVGRTDLPGGSMQTLEQSLRRLVERFDPETKVYPGHRGASTMGEEARSNPWLQG